VTRQNSINMRKQVTMHPILSTTRPPRVYIYIATPHMPPCPLDRSYISKQHTIFNYHTLHTAAPPQQSTSIYTIQYTY
jgi:hypothetical protein